MKKGLVFVAGLFLFLSFIGFVSAGCAANQTIMTLSSSGNAHGALWNQSYITSICYTDKFVDAYGGTNPHDCISSDVLLNLSNISNAHAATISSAMYNISICYKGLTGCRVGSCNDAQNCNRIVFISNTTNAHLATSPAPGYSEISCNCTESGCSKKMDIVESVCSDYTDKDNCNDFAPDVAFFSCNGKYDPKCIWNNDTKKCDTSCVEYADIGTGECARTCTRVGDKETGCAGYSKIVSRIATTTYVPPTVCTYKNFSKVFDCEDDSRTIACGGDVGTILPFFGAWQLVCSLVAIAFVYALLERKRLL